MVASAQARNGTLMVSDGGSITSAGGGVGGNSSSSPGVMTIAGTNSRWTSNGYVSISDYGTLNVTGGRQRQ